jgi:hypothetical protein
LSATHLKAKPQIAVTGTRKNRRFLTHSLDDIINQRIDGFPAKSAACSQTLRHFFGESHNNPFLPVLTPVLLLKTASFPATQTGAGEYQSVRLLSPSLPRAPKDFDFQK